MVIFVGVAQGYFQYLAWNPDKIATGKIIGNTHMAHQTGKETLPFVRVVENRSACNDGFVLPCITR
jgi:hypothetical protein